jgi:hypothetical protein
VSIPVQTIRPPTNEHAGHRQEAELGYLVAEVRPGLDPVVVETCQSRESGTRITRSLSLAYPGRSFAVFAPVVTHTAVTPGKDADVTVEPTT